MFPRSQHSVLIGDRFYPVNCAATPGYAVLFQGAPAWSYKCKKDQR